MRKSKDPLGALDAATRDALPAAGGMDWREPMLATPAERRFSGEEWLFERKFDGVRAVCTNDGERLRLWSRNGNDIGAGYPELVEALREQGGGRFVADGEIVAFEGSRTSFARLQQRIHLTDPRAIRLSGVGVYLYLFDLPAYQDTDLSLLPLRWRKLVLREAFEFHGLLRFSSHRNAEGEEYYRQACSRGWEGLIAKRADMPYESGRSRSWLKFKCVRDQEFVVGGFTDPTGSRYGFGALLVGYFEEGRLRYAGKVGTGYDESVLRRLYERLTRTERGRSPFADRVAGRDVHWVSPEMVVQVGFTEWTSDGRLRHPRFVGVRDDKEPREVVRETP